MARVFPFVPETITVHLGAPASEAENVTVPFIEYIKNVASSEIYPTWDSAALLANINAQVSYALNRIYLEFYPSRGYNFDITNNTAFDQKFIYGRTIFENISDVVDQYFDTYIRRQGFIEPLAAQYCNGTTVTCEGLSQWGSQELAQQGLSDVDILQYYYGNDIEIVPDTRVLTNRPSYPGFEIGPGASGDYVNVIQTELNRISQNYPRIPKIGEVTTFYGELTEEAVRTFQEIFGLTPTGIVNKATWYELIFIYTGVTRLAELNSEGQQLFGTSLEFPDSTLSSLAATSLEYPEGTLEEGDEGQQVFILQYFLNVLSAFYPTVPPVENDGVFGQETHNSVVALQRFLNITPNGIVDANTWNMIYDAYKGIVENVFVNSYIFPEDGIDLGSNDLRFGMGGDEVAALQKFLNSEAESNPSMRKVAENGFFGRHTRWSLSEYQKIHNLTQNGIADEATRNHITNRYRDKASAYSSHPVQFPGKTLKENDQDRERR